MELFVCLHSQNEITSILKKREIQSSKKRGVDISACKLKFLHAPSPDFKKLRYSCVFNNAVIELLLKLNIFSSILTYYQSTIH